MLAWYTALAGSLIVYFWALDLQQPVHVRIGEGRVGAEILRLNLAPVARDHRRQQRALDIAAPVSPTWRHGEDGAVPLRLQADAFRARAVHALPEEDLRGDLSGDAAGRCA